MSTESEELYQRLFQDLNESAIENELELEPDFVLADFEKGSLNGTPSELSSTSSKDHHFHLDQVVYKQI